MKERFIALILLGCISLILCSNSMHRKRNSKESMAIEGIKEMRERLHPKLPFLSSKPLLIGIFMNATKVTSRDIFVENLHLTYERADFVVIIYDGDVRSINRVCNPKNTLSDALASIIHCHRAPISFSTKHRFIPKPLLYPELLPFLPHYQKTMLLDEDMSLSEFNITKFLKIWDCAFYPSQPPLIAQALLAESTQYFHFLHYSEWQKYSNLTKIIASETDFIEQQIPTFDSLFLYWFIEYVMVHVFQYALHYETDWGADGHWCNAAKVFAHHFYGVKTTLPSPYHHKNNNHKVHHSNEYVACALITGSKPIHHKDTRSLKWLKANYDTYHAAGTSVVDIWKSYFPSWKVEYEEPSQIDPTKENRPYRKSYEIPTNCSLIR